MSSLLSSSTQYSPDPKSARKHKVSVSLVNFKELPNEAKRHARPVTHLNSRPAKDGKLDLALKLLRGDVLGKHRPTSQYYPEKTDETYDEMPSIFDIQPKSRRVRERHHSNPKLVPGSPLISMPTTTDTLIERTLQSSRRNPKKKLHSSSVSMSTNTSTAKRGASSSRYYYRGGELSLIDDNKDLRRRLFQQRVKSKDLLHQIKDLTDCLSEEGPCLLRDRLSTKRYNRMVDRVLERRAPQIKQDCIAMSEYIVSLGRSKTRRCR
jgi:hypothetical protein